MKNRWTVPLLVSCAVLLAAGVGLKRGSNEGTQPNCCSPALFTLAAFGADVAKTPVTNAPTNSALPKLVDLGADKCIPCKMMAPVLKELKGDYEGRMEVEFIDVWKNPDAGKPYKIKLIPTQIFYDASGRELFRHEGFFSKADILAKWKELGVEFKAK
jgi:thioredoxin 1